MRIAHRCFDLFVGGAEVVILNTVRALPEHDHFLYFSRHRESWLSRAFAASPNVHLTEVPPFDAPARLTALDADVNLFHYYPPLERSEFERLPGRCLRRSILVNHWHLPVPLLPGIRYLFLSRESRRDTGQSVADARCAIITNPVEESFFDLGPEPSRPFAVGRHSRDVPVKFSTDFFDLHEQLEIPDLQVKVLGAPLSMCQFLAAQSDQLRHNYWLLPFNTMAVKRFLPWLSVFLYKTRDDFAETCPMNILEALASGIPIVAEDKGGIRDLVTPGATGFLCRNPTDFKVAVERLWSDPWLRQETSAAARQWARENAGLAAFRAKLLQFLSL